ncbi:restriction endonuclease subunit S [Acinetobacter sp. T63]
MTYKKYKLEDICEFIKNGKSVQQTKDQKGLPITRIETIANSVIDPAKVGYANLALEGNESYLLKNGDILFSHINSVEHLFKTAKYNGIPEQLIHGMNLLCLRPNVKLIDPQFFLHLLRSDKVKRGLLTYANKSVNQASISATSVKNFEVVIPSLEEQRRIASILDKADAIRQKRQQAIEKLDELLQATFIDMFGDPLDNPKKYQMMTLGSISSFENGDRSNNYPSGADVVQEGIPFLSTKNIKGNFFDSSNMQFITQEKFNKLSRGKVSNGDILITLRGTLGSTCIYECEYPQAFINAQMMIIRANQNFMSNRFLHIILSSEAMQKHLKSIGNGAAVQQLTATQLKNISIIVPDLEEQEKFINFHEKLTKQKKLLEQAFHKINDLFSGLQQKAFNGTL